MVWPTPGETSLVSTAAMSSSLPGWRRTNEALARKYYPPYFALQADAPLHNSRRTPAVRIDPVGRCIDLARVRPPPGRSHSSAIDSASSGNRTAVGANPAHALPPQLREPARPLEGEAVLCNPFFADTDSAVPSS